MVPFTNLQAGTGIPTLNAGTLIPLTIVEVAYRGRQPCILTYILDNIQCSGEGLVHKPRRVPQIRRSRLCELLRRAYLHRS